MKQVFSLLFFGRGDRNGFPGCSISTLPSWFFTTLLKIVVEVAALGPPHVSRLFFGVSKGMLPVEYFRRNKSFLCHSTLMEIMRFTKLK